MKGISITAVAVLLCVQVCSADEPNDSGITFLQPGDLCVITFATELSLIQTQSNSATSTRTLPLFKVLRISGPSWALLEYPINASRWPDWKSSQEAMATLTLDEVQTLAADEDSRAYLGELLTFYSDKLAKIETAKSWVNLSYATTIYPLPPKPDHLKKIKEQLANRASQQAK